MPKMQNHNSRAPNPNPNNKNLNGEICMSQQKTKQFNVTDMTPSQQHELFKECMDQTGFKAFIKHQNNQQTHYTFQYKN
jgi:hypothetical protein